MKRTLTVAPEFQDFERAALAVAAGEHGDVESESLLLWIRLRAFSLATVRAAERAGFAIESGSEVRFLLQFKGDEDEPSAFALAWGRESWSGPMPDSLRSWLARPTSAALALDLEPRALAGTLHRLGGRAASGGAGPYGPS